MSRCCYRAGSTPMLPGTSLPIVSPQSPATRATVARIRATPFPAYFRSFLAEIGERSRVAGFFCFFESEIRQHGYTSCFWVVFPRTSGLFRRCPGSATVARVAGHSGTSPTMFPSPITMSPFSTIDFTIRANTPGPRRLPTSCCSCRFVIGPRWASFSNIFRDNSAS